MYITLNYDYNNLHIECVNGLSLNHSVLNLKIEYILTFVLVSPGVDREDGAADQIYLQLNQRNVSHVLVHCLDVEIIQGYSAADAK